jgi:hypothetical protein
LLALRSTENDTKSAASLTLGVTIDHASFQSLPAAPIVLLLAISLYRSAMFETVEVNESSCHF